ncbi:MAG TPA: MBL fold metallo-hydrolase [Terriglobia bacterium]|nr:MBL fold metallo-hydrolase [Terriglobia bacterium]
MNKRTLVFLAAFAAVLSGTIAAYAQGQRGRGAAGAQGSQLRVAIFDPQQKIYYADANDRTVRALPVRDNVWMIVGAGGNITVQTGDDGVLVVDTGNGGGSTDKVQAILRAISTKPIRYILNTSFRPDHTGGNDGMRGTAGGGGRGGPGGPGGGRGTPIAAHENVLGRMSAPTGKTAPTPTNAWPSETYYKAFRDLYFNGEGIQMIHIPDAITDGDSIVYFRKSDVIAAGDIFLTTTYPVIDLKAGGSINGVIAGLNKLLDICIPKEKQEGGTTVIPGHGRISDEADVLEYRDMLTIIRDRIQDAIKKGRTLQQIQAAGLTKDYDGRYGATTGPWTTAMFVEAAYQSLKGN